MKLDMADSLLLLGALTMVAGVAFYSWPGALILAGLFLTAGVLIFGGKSL